MATRRGGLGKGLGALISASALDGDENADTPESGPPLAALPQRLEDGSLLIMIDPRTVRPNPKQPRHYFDEDALLELADSIRQDGLHEPVVVRPHGDDGFELVSGERRVRASVLAELDRIPAVCREVSDDDMLKLGLIENIQREDLNPIELAKAYKALGEHFGWTQDELAQQVGKKRATVTNTMRLLNLTEEVQDMVVSGELSMGHARALLAAESPGRQVTLARRVVTEGLSVRETEKLASKRPKTEPDPGPPKPKDPHIASVEDELRRRLGTKVQLKANDGWKGRIEIDFYSLEELERILDILRT